VLLRSFLDLPVDVEIDAGVIGGPSAGLMFALSVMDLLEPEDLTGGKVVAGTGTVDRDGTVGAVGGVRQKVVGATATTADQRPATVFLVPEGNLEDARSVSVPREVLVVPVATLDDAVRALDDLRAGREPAGALALPERGD
jgi:Lon-like protease